MAEWRRISARISACAAPWFARVASTCPLCLAATRGGRVCLLCHAALRQGAGLLPPAGLAGVDEWCQAFAYAPPGDVLIWQYKVSLRLRHARLVASLMAEAWQQRENDCRASRALSMPGPVPVRVPVLVPVPSSRRSLARRGFNPARELSRHLAGMLGLRERPEWLLRHETRHKQAGLGREARRAILDGVFYCPALPEGAAVILVDDVVTTGSTASAAARALKAAGASRVAVLAAARVPPPGKTPAGQVS